MNLNFSSEKVLNDLLKVNKVNYENGITSADAFFIVLKDVDFETIENLCLAMSEDYPALSPLGIYNIIQNNNCYLLFKMCVLKKAYELIHSGKNLGNKIINGKFNASSWIAHSLYEGEMMAFLAKQLKLDSDTAMKVGILHDIGRKFEHSFIHTVKGYEYLLEQGLECEAICCLTHSFLPTDNRHGNRCANCEPALEGFYINRNGEGVFKPKVDVDHVGKFLENYEYNLYDMILCVSDLTAMSNGITSPYERVKDVYSRKNPDYNNSSFFNICFINLLRKVLFLITYDNKYLKVYNVLDFTNEQVDELFCKTSNEFMKIIGKLADNNNLTFKKNN